MLVFPTADDLDSRCCIAPLTLQLVQEHPSQLPEQEQTEHWLFIIIISSVFYLKEPSKRLLHRVKTYQGDIVGGLKEMLREYEKRTSSFFRSLQVLLMIWEDKGTGMAVHRRFWLFLYFLPHMLSSHVLSCTDPMHTT